MASKLSRRVKWLFHRPTTPAERQMLAFRAAQSALARATAKGQPTLN